MQPLLPLLPLLACDGQPVVALPGRLGTTVPKTLNVGLLVAALFHILELGGPARHPSTLLHRLA